jgi:hypothetical protein
MEHLHQLLYLAQVGFTIWMLVDAYRRSAEWFWFWIILLLQPIGAWVYFFLFKARDLAGLKVPMVFQRRISLDELRYRVEQTPTLANHAALAERLMERGEFEEAIPHLEKALAMEPDHCQILYSLTVCYRATGQTDKSLPLLDRLLIRDRRWSDYAAWRLLIEARGELGDQEGALAAARELERLAPTLQHRCLLAGQLLNAGLLNEAGELLERSLQDHQFAPGPIRRRNRRWAGEARRLQKRLGELSG